MMRLVGAASRFYLLRLSKGEEGVSGAGRKRKM